MSRRLVKEFAAFRRSIDYKREVRIWQIKRAATS